MSINRWTTSIRGNALNIIVLPIQWTNSTKNRTNFISIGMLTKTQPQNPFNKTVLPKRKMTYLSNECND